MIDKYFRADTEQELFDALEEGMKMLDDDENVILRESTEDYAWNWGLPIEEVGAVMDGDEIVTQAVLREGFFANLRLMNEFSTAHLDQFETVVTSAHIEFAKKGV